MELTVLQSMVDRFQCTGCTLGSDTKTCESFRPSDSMANMSCKSWSPGTMAFPGGRMMLGLPTGFDHLGACEVGRSFKLLLMTRDEFIRRSQTPTDGYGTFDTFNVPVWAMVEDGFLFVRRFAPRINFTSIDVVKDGTMDLLPASVVDVAKFVDKID